MLKWFLVLILLSGAHAFVYDAVSQSMGPFEDKETHLIVPSDAFAHPNILLRSRAGGQSDLPPKTPPSELILLRDKPLPKPLEGNECITGRINILDPDSPYSFGHFSGAFAAEIPRRQKDGTFAVTRAGGYIGKITERSDKGWTIQLSREGEDSVSIQLGDYASTPEGAIIVGVTRYANEPCRLTAPEKAVTALRTKFPSIDNSAYIIVRISGTLIARAP